MEDAKDLSNEIMDQVVKNGEGKSEQEIRALIEEQLAIKGESYRTVRAMMSRWDSKDFWMAVDYAKKGRKDHP